MRHCKVIECCILDDESPATESISHILVKDIIINPLYQNYWLSILRYFVINFKPVTSSIINYSREKEDKMKRSTILNGQTKKAMKGKEIKWRHDHIISQNMSIFLVHVMGLQDPYAQPKYVQGCVSFFPPLFRHTFHINIYCLPHNTYASTPTITSLTQILPIFQGKISSFRPLLV